MNKIFKKIILVVEDETSIADSLIYILNKEGFVATHARTLSEARQIMESQSVSALILDVGLPDGSGFEFCKEIRKKSETPILFLTARHEEIDKIVGLEIGADDYVTKPFSPREVVARLNAILRRTEKSEKTKSDNEEQFFVDKNKLKILYKGQSLELSRYEFGILEMLLERRGQVFSRQQIMMRVWESPDMSLERTVDTHIKTLRSKLNLISEDEILITHRGIGYSVRD